MQDKKPITVYVPVIKSTSQDTMMPLTGYFCTPDEWKEIQDRINPVEDVKYPIGGYAPGNYICLCCNCDKQFKGDKRSVQCESCARETNISNLVEIVSIKDIENAIKEGIRLGITGEIVVDKESYYERKIKEYANQFKQPTSPIK
jgi:hypothetical protein